MSPGRRRVAAAAAAALVGAVVLALAWGLYAPQDPAPPGGGARAAAMIEDLAALSDEDAFARPTGPWQLSLPSDHGAHPGARAETWLLSAHLENGDGDAIGVHFALSRFGLRAEASGPDGGPWNLRALYRAHLTLVLETDARVLAEERFSRGAGAAGHDAKAREVWLDHWTLRYGEGPDGDALTLAASVDGVPIRLDLRPARQAAPAAPDGTAPMRGFAVSRLAVEGEIGRGEHRTGVAGLAWLDRLWGELPLPGGPLAYDRLVLQLDDGTDVSLVRTHRGGRGGAATVDGFVVAPSGEIAAVSEEVLELTPVARWSPPASDGSYPVGWRIAGAGLDLRVTPVVEDQRQDFALPAWTGLVRAEGTHGNVKVEGLGTLQLSGYEDS